MKWLPLAVIAAAVIILYYAYKKQPVTTPQTPQLESRQFILEPTPAPPTTPAPEVKVIMPTPEEFAQQIQAAADAGQEKLVYNPPDPVTVDIPSVVESAVIAGQSLDQWLYTNLYSYQPTVLGTTPTGTIYSGQVTNPIMDYRVSLVQQGYQPVVNNGVLTYVNPATGAVAAGSP